MASESASDSESIGSWSSTQSSSSGSTKYYRSTDHEDRIAKQLKKKQGNKIHYAVSPESSMKMKAETSPSSSHQLSPSPVPVNKINDKTPLSVSTDKLMVIDPVTAANTRANSRSPPVTHSWENIYDTPRNVRDGSRSSSESSSSPDSTPDTSSMLQSRREREDVHASLSPVTQSTSRKRASDGSALVKFIVEQFAIDVSPLESGFRRRDMAGDAFVDVSCKEEAGALSPEEARLILKRIRENTHEEVNSKLLKDYRKAHRACVKLSLQMTEKFKSLHRSIEGKCLKARKEKVKFERSVSKLEYALEESELKNDALIKQMVELEEQHSKEMEREVKFRNALTDAHATQLKRYIDELREVSERDDPYTLRVEDNELRSATVVKNLEWKMHALKEQHRLELDQMRQVINEEKAKSREKEGVWEKRVAKLLREIKEMRHNIHELEDDNKKLSSTLHQQQQLERMREVDNMNNLHNINSDVSGSSSDSKSKQEKKQSSEATATPVDVTSPSLQRSNNSTLSSSLIGGLHQEEIRQRKVPSPLSAEQPTSSSSFSSQSPSSSSPMHRARSRSTEKYMSRSALRQWQATHHHPDGKPYAAQKTNLENKNNEGGGGMNEGVGWEVEGVRSPSLPVNVNKALFGQHFRSDSLDPSPITDPQPVYRYGAGPAGSATLVRSKKWGDVTLTNTESKSSPDKYGASFQRGKSVEYTSPVKQLGSPISKQFSAPLSLSGQKSRSVAEKIRNMEVEETPQQRSYGETGLGSVGSSPEASSSTDQSTRSSNILLRHRRVKAAASNSYVSGQFHAHTSPGFVHGTPHPSLQAASVAATTPTRSATNSHILHSKMSPHY